MSKFTKKAKPVTSGGSNIAPEEWKAWNDYLYECIQEATEDGDEPEKVCFISGLIDSGSQPPMSEFTEYDFKDTEQQQKLIKAGVATLSDDETKIRIKNRHQDSIIIAVDFPSVMVDYSKHPLSQSDEPDLRPYRDLYAGEWKLDGKTRANVVYLSPNPKKGGYDPKSTISKLAKATGLVKGKVPVDFDIGSLLGEVFMMSITAEWGGDKDQFLNIKLTEPRSKLKAVPVPEHNIEPFAAMLDGGNDEEDLKQVNSKVINRLEMADGWDESGLKAELEKLGRLGGNASTSSTEEKDEDDDSKSSKESKPKTKPKAKPEVEQEEDEEEDDENPFE